MRITTQQRLADWSPATVTHARPSESRRALEEVGCFTSLALLSRGVVSLLFGPQRDRVCLMGVHFSRRTLDGIVVEGLALVNLRGCWVMK